MKLGFPQLIVTVDTRLAGMFCSICVLLASYGMEIKHIIDTSIILAERDKPTVDTAIVLHGMFCSICPTVLIATELQIMHTLRY